MRWLFKAAHRLREHGILGMNERNASCILDRNPRALYPIVDDKLRMRELCRRIGVPTPEVYAEIGCHSQVARLSKILEPYQDFVLKPNRGSGGRGILVIVARAGGNYVRHNGEVLLPGALAQHVSDILCGMYSLGGRTDRVLVQQRVHIHETFAPVSYKGIPDMRIIVYRNQPAMAMLRLPTKESGGRANLHQGGIGAGVDLATGETIRAVQKNQVIRCHPDTGNSLLGVKVPQWPELLEMSRRVAQAVGLGYLGVDIVVDARDGPMLLEANARPGLAIQMANGFGLLPRLREIDRNLAGRFDVGERYKKWEVGGSTAAARAS
jgi:alpha-L-glutamate ligase-like protein